MEGVACEALKCEAARAAIEIAQKLREGGHEALLAGGCVRDLLLGRAPSDFDVATNATPERVCALFRSTRQVGAQFGVVLVKRRGRWVEVATFRSDGKYSDGRRPDSVTFGDARGDAARRDFTVNGMFLDPETMGVIDYVGGRVDLELGVVRAIGEAAARFEEDHLRLLRAVRFAARLGFEIEEGTMKAAKANAAKLSGVAAERVLDELERMLSHRSRARAVRLMREAGLLPYVWHGAAWDPGYVEAAIRLLDRMETTVRESRELVSPRADEDDRLEADATKTKRPHVDGTSKDGPEAGATLRGGMSTPVTYGRFGARVTFEGAFAVLVGDRPTAEVEEVCRRLTMSNEQREAVAWLVRHQGDLDDPERPTLAELKRLMGHRAFGDLRAIAEGRYARMRDEELEMGTGGKVGDPQEREEGKERARRLGERVGAIRPEDVAPTPLVTGEDLIARGVAAGPVYKRVLDELYTRQLNEVVRTREEALREMEGMLAANGA